MNILINKIKSVVTFLKTFLPYPLPIGMQEFDRWAASVLKAAKAPDNDSTRFALSTMILHAGSTDAYKPKRYFVLTLKKSMANQIAGAIMHELKDKQAKAQAAAAASEAAGLSNASQK